MTFPLWAIFGLGSATLSAGVMLVQERFRLNGFVMAFWNKVACAVFALPFVIYFGIPDNPYFYALLTLQALLWVVSDVIFFNAIPKVGAGVVSRILPVSVLVTFCLWFIFDPALIGVYVAAPVKSGLIVLVLALSVYFSVRIKRCPVSWQAVRLIWFVLLAATIGPVLAKLVTQYGSVARAPFAYVFFEALVMISIWSVYYRLKRPVESAVMFSREALKGGFAVGLVSCFMVASNVAAIGLVDNPGLIPAVKFVDTIIILGYYRWAGREDGSDVWAGLGIVACAAALIILKSL